jgi:hypothetical protein
MSTRSVLAQTAPASRGRKPRPRLAKHLIHEVARSVTARDKQICLDIYEHRFLTTHQSARLHFGSEPRARARLHQLWLNRVLDRFRPERTTGSHPWHYVLDEVGVAIVEQQLGIERLRYDKRKALAQVFSPNLVHNTAVNDFFSRLAEVLRSVDGWQLATWLGERSCEEHWRGACRPDGSAILEGPSGAMSFCLELDRGTEDGARLAAKLDDYAALDGGADAPDVVLFCFESPVREAAQRRALAGYPVTIATASLADHTSDPLAANWLPIGAAQRHAITELSGSHARSSAA